MNKTVLSLNSRLLWLILSALAASGSILYLGFSPYSPPVATESEMAAMPTELPGVAALGRLEPTGEIVQVAAPLELDGDRLAELFVDVGDRVNQGDAIAVLDSYDRLQNTVIQAQQHIRLAEARLAQVQAGAKSGEILAQQATVTQRSAELTGQLRIQRETIARIEAQYEGDRAAQTATIRRLQAELQTAVAELTRYQSLYEAGAISASLYDAKQLVVDTARQAKVEAVAVLERTSATAQRQLQEARAELVRLENTGQAQLAAAQSTLAQVAEIRPVDVQLAQVELDAAKAALVSAEHDLAKATIRAPSAGQVLKVYTRPGEQMSTDGIVALGQTDQMLVIAEVYQSDIGRVRLGQPTTVRGQAFSGELQGEVIEIGRQVSRQNVFAREPGENLDRRVVEVKIALSPEDSQRVANFSNLQVQALIAVNRAAQTPPTPAKPVVDIGLGNSSLQNVLFTPFSSNVSF
ncbi:abc exporter membrane fusion family [Leptolyngbya sp. Heron Island J]|uniref:efflux RND transporter periplasmic adaptor subunit n=1 Tax=Leptolyngbya sp. Heron Island J TaxID=1385935 RepID=UPI0003B96315|nr:efflux RND transporter periplasmic adaptor subunit [Leptolyngbya sp. Heron Island J]ESA36377.1 abc exporter membrane fusion family [Leptolyngbya sp. Heron Island J]